MSMSVSPLTPKKYPKLAPVEGLRMETAQAGIKYKDRTDVLMMVFDKPAAVAGVFTRSLCPSAPVDHCRAILSHGYARAVVVNSGNANAFTGKKGKAATVATAAAAVVSSAPMRTQPAPLSAVVAQLVSAPDRVTRMRALSASAKSGSTAVIWQASAMLET